MVVDVDGGRLGNLDGRQRLRRGFDAVGLVAPSEQPQCVGSQYLPLDGLVQVAVEYEVQRGPHGTQGGAGGVEHPVGSGPLDQQLHRARRREPRRVDIDVVVLLDDGQDLVEQVVEGSGQVQRAAQLRGYFRKLRGQSSADEAAGDQGQTGPGDLGERPARRQRRERRVRRHVERQRRGPVRHAARDHRRQLGGGNLGADDTDRDQPFVRGRAGEQVVVALAGVGVEAAKAGDRGAAHAGLGHLAE